ncbi:MAG: Hint domain-containing protein [Candidatus Hermodarchaeota archaeon]
MTSQKIISLSVVLALTVLATGSLPIFIQESYDFQSVQLSDDETTYEVADYSSMSSSEMPPHPRPIRINQNSMNGALQQNHWYVGAVHEITWFSSTSVEVSIDVPNYPADPDDFYYVLLSIWDSADSYDQFGFSSFHGDWGLTYSWTEPCPEENEDYHFDPNAMALTQGQRYTFQMTIASGFLTYRLFLHGGLVWDLTVFTGGTLFWAENYHWCGWHAYYGYTNYEEVYDLDPSQPVPFQSFYFWENKFGGELKDTFWAGFRAGNYPSQATWRIENANIFIANHYFGLNVEKGGNIRVATGTTSWVTWGEVPMLHDPLDCWLTDCQVSLTAASYPTGWIINIYPNRAMPTFTFSITFTIPQGFTPGVYHVPLHALNIPRGQWTRFMLHVTVIHRRGSGCVAEGTLILTPTGYVPVQTLDIGNLIVGYNLTTKSFVNLTIITYTPASEEWTISINNGFLRVTIVDQPLYIRNSTYEGWLYNPQNLTMGDLLYNPLEDKWIVVDDIQFLYESIAVYSFLIPEPGTFISNSALLHYKI